MTLSKQSSPVIVTWSLKIRPEFIWWRGSETVIMITTSVLTHVRDKLMKDSVSVIISSTEHIFLQCQLTVILLLWLLSVGNAPAKSCLSDMCCSNHILHVWTSFDKVSCTCSSRYCHNSANWMDSSGSFTVSLCLIATSLTTMLISWVNNLLWNGHVK